MRIHLTELSFISGNLIAPFCVSRLVSKDTVDENILRIAQSKLKLDAAILDTSSGQGVEGEVDTMASILSAVLGIGTQKK